MKGGLTLKKQSEISLWNWLMILQHWLAPILQPELWNVCLQIKPEECHKTFPVRRCFSGSTEAQRPEETTEGPVRRCAIFHQTSGTRTPRKVNHLNVILQSNFSVKSVWSTLPPHIVPPLLFLSGIGWTETGGEHFRYRGISQPGRPLQSSVSAPTQCWVLRKLPSAQDDMLLVLKLTEKDLFCPFTVVFF